MSIRVLISDDQELVRAGFRMVVEARDDLEVVGEAGDGEEALRLVDQLHPDGVVDEAHEHALTEHIGRPHALGEPVLGPTGVAVVHVLGAMDRKLLARQLESAVRGSTVAALRTLAAA